MGWLSGEQALRVLFALPVGVLLARYLGAERFGLLCYAQALVTMFIPLAASGMSGIVVRDLVREGCSKEETLGSAFMIQFVGATLAALLSIIAVLILRPGETLVQLIVVIVSARNLFAAFNVIDYWYQHKVDPGQVATGRLLAAFLIAGVKLLLIWLKASLLYFAAVLVAEVALIAGFFYYIYVNDADRLDPWRVSIDRVKSLLYESWPLTLTGFAILVQAYIDQVMLGNMLGDEVVGQYSVAIRLIGYLAFLPVALHKSWAPSVTAAKEKGQEAYDRRMSQLYQLMFGIFLLQGIPIFLLASPLILLVYGEEFSEAGTLLSLLAIRLLFTNYGLARGVFIANESLFRHSMITAIAGSVFNVAANYLLIPHFGAIGAIIATIGSFAVTVFILDAMYDGTKNNFKLMMQSPWRASSNAMRFVVARVNV